MTALVNDDASYTLPGTLSSHYRSVRTHKPCLAVVPQQPTVRRALQ